MHETPLRFLTPTFWQGAGKRGERLDQLAKEETMGAGEEFWEKRFKGKKAAMPREELAYFSNINKQRSQIREELQAAGNDRKKMQEIGLRVFNTGGDEGDRLKSAFLAEIQGRGNWDDMWEQIAEDMEKDPELRKKIPPEIREQLTSYNDVSSRNLALLFSGLDRHKLDPMTIAADIMKKEADPEKQELAKKILKVDSETNMNALDGADARQALDPEAKSYLNEVLEKAQGRAKNNAIKKTSRKEKLKLKAMVMAGIEAREETHWEQQHAFIDPATRSAYIATPEEVLAESKGEIEKMGLRKFQTQISPHLTVPRFWDPKRKMVRRRHNPKYQTVLQRGFLESVYGAQMTADAHHQGIRLPRENLGIEGGTSKLDAITTEEGGIYDGSSQLQYDEESGKYTLPRNKNGEIDFLQMDEQMNDYYREMVEEEGKDPEEDEQEIIKYMMKRRKQYSEEVLKRIYGINPAFFNIEHGVAFHGKGDAKQPGMFSPGGKGLGQAFTREIMADKERFKAQLKNQKIFLEEELEDDIKEGKKKPEERAQEMKKIKEYTTAAIDYWDAENKKTPFDEEEKNEILGKSAPKMVDISEERQKATRAKVQEQGEAFFTSEEYLGNKDKYYDEASYSANEQVVQALKKQKDVSAMTGVSSALKTAEKGGSAALAVDFEDKELSGLGLKGAGAYLKGEEMTQAIDKLGEKYLENLIKQNENLSDDQKKTEEQMAKEVEEFKQKLSQASSLRLINKNRKGVDVRHILTHEKYHDEIENKVESGDLNLEDQWKAMTEEEQNEIKNQLAGQGWEVQSMGIEEIMKEYLAEGLTNQTKYAQKGGLKIKAAHFDTLKEKGFDVRGEMPVEMPEIQEIEKTPSLARLAQEALAKKAAKAMRFPFVSISQKWQKQRQARKKAKGYKESEKEYRVAEKESASEMENLPKLQQEEKDYITQRDEQTRIRKEAEEHLAEEKKHASPRLANLNKEIKLNSEKAREEASKGNVSGASEYHKKAEAAKKEAVMLSERIRKAEEGVKKARKDEQDASAQALAAKENTKNAKAKVEQAVEHGSQAAYGTGEDYQRYIAESVQEGVKNFGGEEGYKKEIKKTIAYYQSQIGKGSPDMDFSCRVNIKQLEDQLRTVESGIKGKDLEFEAKISSAGGLDKYRDQLEKQISGLDQQIKLAPAEQKVKLEADQNKLKDELSQVNDQIFKADAYVELGVKNAGGLDQYSKQLNKKIDQAQKELDEAPAEEKSRIEFKISGLKNQKAKVESRIFERDEQKAINEAKKAKESRMEEHHQKAKEYESQAEARTKEGKFSEAREFHQKAEKEKEKARKISEEEIVIKPVVKESEISGEVPVEVRPAMNNEQVQAAMQEIMAMEEGMGLPGQGEIDPKLFSNMTQDIAAAIKSMEEGIKSAVSDMGRGASESTKKITDGLTGQLKKRIESQQERGGASSRQDQYFLLYEFRKMAESIKQMRSKSAGPEVSKPKSEGRAK